MTSKSPAPASTPQEEYEAELRQNQVLQKHHEDLQNRLATIEKRKKALQQLCETIQASKVRLIDQLKDINDVEEQKRNAAREESEQSLREYQESLDKSKIPLNLEKSQYEMVKARYQYLTDCWEAKKAHLSNSIAQTRYNTQLLKAKIREMHDRIEKFKAALKNKYPNMSFDDDPTDGAFSAVFSKQLRFQQEANEKQEQKEELEKKCRELQRRRDLLKKNSSNFD
ncbi:hypothetical protein TRFO_37126 [Tritrichomonas foetus]|uniref:Uncharacterized protein n=1 Tax=Tritrichomonas foetus TaxID=1144522 RepID=A0A1J4JC47_9EUKA|nr:hypothetical protein TRFO_37126 [Tritrichomonas foetus]|eukprot:OHS96712.1 hypothetical protein TRFO_37126 [Tritrichomonas foetus]